MVSLVVKAHHIKDTGSIPTCVKPISSLPCHDTARILLKASQLDSFTHCIEMFHMLFLKVFSTEKN